MEATKVWKQSLEATFANLYFATVKTSHDYVLDFAQKSSPMFEFQDNLILIKQKIWSHGLTFSFQKEIAEPEFTYSKSTMETRKKVCSKVPAMDVVQVSLLLALNTFHILCFWCILCWLETSKYRLKRNWYSTNS